MASSALSIDYINPFIEATVETFKTMCSLDVTREAAAIQHGNQETSGLTGIMQLSGEANGSIIINLPDGVSLAAVAATTGTSHESINADVVEGITELSNAIASDAKNRLEQKGFSFHISPPKVVVGRNHVTSKSGAATSILISFRSDVGSFSIAVSLKKG